MYTSEILTSAFDLQQTVPRIINYILNYSEFLIKKFITEATLVKFYFFQERKYYKVFNFRSMEFNSVLTTVQNVIYLLHYPQLFCSSYRPQDQVCF